MKLKKWELALLFALALALSVSAVVTSEQRELSSKLIRLHVVGNSDSAEDQAAKLKVRDAVYVYVEHLLEGTQSREEAEKRIKNDIEVISWQADRAAKSAGQKGASATLAVESFPTREYDTFSLPAGDYTSLRVTIGEGEGENWWCVVFPPLCMGVAQKEQILETFSISEDEAIMITSGYTVKFRILEWINELKHLFS